MPLFNDCEMFSHNEEIYYSFFKNLIFAFSELHTIEGIYSKSISRVLYFLKLNDKKIDECPVLQIRKVLTDYLENIKNQHIQFSNDCNNLYIDLTKLYQKNQENRSTYLKDKETLDKHYTNLKVEYDRKKKEYEKIAKEVARQYRNMSNNNNDETQKDYETKKADALVKIYLFYFT